MIESGFKKVYNLIFNQFLKFQEVQLNFFLISSISQYSEQKFETSYDYLGLKFSLFTLSIIIFV